MAEILQNPMKLTMLLIMLGLGIAGVAFLVTMWIRDAKSERKMCDDSYYNRYAPAMNKVAIEMLERHTKVMKEFDDGCTVKILGADKPIIRDTVEVVRCKDCAYWKEYDGEMFCYNWCGLHSDTTEDDFCSYGSRKENKDG